MPTRPGWQVRLYWHFAIVAVGVTSSLLIAVLGSMGLLVTCWIFVILGLSRRRAHRPVGAVPVFFRWLAQLSRCTRCS